MIVLVCDRLDEMLCQRLTLVFYGVWWFLTGKPSRVSTCACTLSCDDRNRFDSSLRISPRQNTVFLLGWRVSSLLCKNDYFYFDG
jgi:hypothetical protein